MEFFYCIFWGKKATHVDILMNLTVLLTRHTMTTKMDQYQGAKLAIISVVEQALYLMLSNYIFLSSPLWISCIIIVLTFSNFLEYSVYYFINLCHVE